MKLFSKTFIATLFLLISGLHLSKAQLFVDTIYDVPTMVNDFFDGSCVDVLNVTYQGSPDNMSFFEGSQSNIGLDMGILLTNGNVYDAVGPNEATGTSTILNVAGDADLDQLTLFPTYDASVIEIDIVPHVDTIFFDYVFASEEYSEFVGTSFNDVFGFFISGPGITGTQNIALIPGSNLPVTINNVNCVNGSPFYVCNDPMNNTCGGGYTCTTAGDTTAVEYDGFTTTVNAYAVVIPDSTYHVKIAVADASDAIYDSGIFLGIGSLCGDGQKPAADYNYVTSSMDVTFENLAMYVREYHWDFGDGSVSAERNPDHEFAIPGIYNVMMIATNYKGSDTVVKTIDLLGTSVTELPKELQLQSNPVSGSINFINQLTGPVDLSLYDASGKLVLKQVGNNGNFSVNVTGLASGIYIAELTTPSKIYRVKVVKE